MDLVVPGGSVLGSASCATFFAPRAIAAHESPDQDLLALILSARDQGWMSDELARDEAVSLLLGAYDSTARALTWTWALLAAHPDARARLHAAGSR